MQRNNASQGGGQRPSVLTDLSTTQLDELERQFNEGDHQAWNTLTESYGWAAEQGQAVWDWFGQDPEGGHGSSAAGSSQSSTAGSYATDSEDSVPTGGTGTGATSSMGSGTGHVAQHGSGGGTGEVH
ncbi:MAG: hypothetical protein M3Z04_18225 [Chloroflexota bacterium]|nr:hypothetical protein [Chloroflexota bacterium]